MKYWILLIMFMTSLLLIGCDDDPAEIEGVVWFELTADKQSGTKPLTVNFTGILHGDIRGMRLRCPDAVLCPGYGKTCIIYCPVDTTYSARRTYEKQWIYESSGEFGAYMMLQSVDGRIVSDTLVITVLE